MGYILYVEILIYNTVHVAFWRLLVINAKSLSLRGLPSSFKGAHGKIHYRLSGKLSRSKRAASKAEAKFTFVARADYDHSTLMVWSQFLSVRPEKYSKPHFNAWNTKQTYVDQ